jgi:hypothetical protein
MSKNQFNTCSKCQNKDNTENTVTPNKVDICQNNELRKLTVHSHKRANFTNECLHIR